MRSKSGRNGWELQCRQRQPEQQGDQKRRPNQAENTPTQPSLNRYARHRVGLWERSPWLGRPGGKMPYDRKMKR